DFVVGRLFAFHEREVERWGRPLAAHGNPERFEFGFVLREKGAHHRFGAVREFDIGHAGPLSFRGRLRRRPAGQTYYPGEDRGFAMAKGDPWEARDGRAR